jgi:hypothetical protein
MRPAGIEPATSGSGGQSDVHDARRRGTTIASSHAGFPFPHGAYVRDVGPMLEEASGQPFEDIPPQELLVLGVVVGGFSAGAFLSELWEIVMPVHSDEGSAVLHPQGVRYRAAARVLSDHTFIDV